MLRINATCVQRMMTVGSPLMARAMFMAWSEQRSRSEIMSLKMTPLRELQ